MKTAKKVLVLTLSCMMILAGLYFAKTEGIEANAENSVENAKDMNKGLLDVKVQTTADGSIMRFITSVDSLNYHKVGFKVTPEGKDAIMHPIKTVFEEIKSTTAGVEYEFSPKVVDTKSEYFATAKMNVSDITKKYTVQAYVVLLDGTTTIYGAERCVAAEDGISTTSVNVSFDAASVLPEGTKTISNVTYKTKAGTDASTDATVIATSADGKTVHTRVNVNPDDLQSATKFTFGEYGSAIFRNLYTTHVVAGSATAYADTSWYDVYAEDTSETEFVIATSADLYGFAKKSASYNFDGKIVYLASDVFVNEGEATTTGWDTTGNGATNYQWPVIGANWAHKFNGTFDGQGHVISGVYREDATAMAVNNENYSGLFGLIDANALIQDFRLENSYFKRTNQAAAFTGSIIGCMRGGTLKSVYSDAIVTSDGNHFGGLVGKAVYVNASNNNIIIENCWFDGEVIAKGTGCNMGGIVGTAGQSGNKSNLDGVVTIKSCLNSGTISCDATALDGDGVQYIGGIIGRTHWAVITLNIDNCLNTGELLIPIETPKAVGAIIGAAQRSGSVLNITNTCASSESYETALDKNSGQCNGTVNGSTKRWLKADMTSYWGYANISTDANSIHVYTYENPTGTFVIKENGTPELKYFSEHWLDFGWYYKNRSAKEFTIHTAEEFYTLPIIVNNNYQGCIGFSGDTVYLAEDIELNDGNAAEWSKGVGVSELRKWTPIGISAIDKTFTGTFDGQGHTISGLYFTNENTTAENYSGLFGETEITTTVKNFKLTNSYLKRAAFTSSKFASYGNNWAWLGSVIGHMRGGCMENVYSDAIVTSNGTQMGGLVGVAQYDNWGTHRDTMNVTIQNCWFDGQVIATENACDLGGIIGVAQQYSATSTNAGIINIENCLNSGEISVEGISGTIDDKAQFVGGIIGRDAWRGLTINITSCLNTGQISVPTANQKAVGSIIGAAQRKICIANITNTYATDESYRNSTGQAIGVGTDKTSGTVNGSVTLVSEADIIGEKATTETGCPNLLNVAESAWVIEETGTPILKTFATWWKARR